MSNPAPPRVETSRLRALDGLRGIAAVMVVLHHSLLLNPSFAAIYFNPSAPAVPGSVGALVTSTPLQLLFSGPEAVLVFFVLSGLAVALPPLRRPAFDWRAYYPQRLIRLLVPVVASVILAGVITALTLRDPATAASQWVAGSTFSALQLKDVVQSFDVLVSSDAINNPLWSLRYELLFSLLLPLFVVAALAIGRRVWVAVVIVAPAVLAGWYFGDAVWSYLPVFLLGTVIAVNLDAVTAVWSRFTPTRRALMWSGLLVVGVFMLEAHWILDPLRHGSETLSNLARVISACGAGIIVACAVGCAPMVTFLESRIVQWLGRISFSLYLVHVPVLVASAGLFRGAPWYVADIVGIPTAVVIAIVFARWIEGPSHRLSQRVGRAVSQRWPVLPASDP